MSKKMRFEIFKRDGFKCQYCGAVPSETVVLEVDHIEPLARGGSDDPDNLITACFACNRGKAARSLDAIPQSLQDRAELIAEREAQIRAYYDVLQEAKDRKEWEINAIGQVFMTEFHEDGLRKGYWSGIQRFLERLDFFEVLEAAEIACGRWYSVSRAFRYFCGICWNKIRRMDEPAEDEAGNVSPLAAGRRAEG
jgi:hypothetical protein